MLPNNDTMLIGTAGAPQGIVYDGAWNASPSNFKYIVGANSNNAGDLVCSSGAMSGIHCNLRISGIGTLVRNVGETVVGGSWKVTVQAAGSGVWTSGDSGGPIFVLYDSSLGRWGRGLIQGHPKTAGTQPCQTPPQSTGKCWTVGYYAPLLETLNDYSMRLKTRNSVAR